MKVSSLKDGSFSFSLELKEISIANGKYGFDWGMAAFIIQSAFTAFECLKNGYVGEILCGDTSDRIVIIPSGSVNSNNDVHLAYYLSQTIQQLPLSGYRPVTHHVSAKITESELQECDTDFCRSLELLRAQILGDQALVIEHLLDKFGR